MERGQIEIRMSEMSNQDRDVHGMLCDRVEPQGLAAEPGCHGEPAGYVLDHDRFRSRIGKVRGCVPSAY